MILRGSPTEATALPGVEVTDAMDADTDNVARFVSPASPADNRLPSGQKILLLGIALHCGDAAQLSNAIRCNRCCSASPRLRARDRMDPATATPS